MLQETQQKTLKFVKSPMREINFSARLYVTDTFFSNRLLVLDHLNSNLSIYDIECLSESSAPPLP